MTQFDAFTSSHIMSFGQLLKKMNHLALLVWRNDEQWTVQYASKGLFDMLGYETDLAALPPYAQLIAEEDIQNVKADLDKALAENSTYFRHDDYRLINKQGNSIWIQDDTLIVHQDDGSHYYVGCLIDITQRKQVEQELDSKRKRLELVLEGTRLGLWDWNPQSGEVIFNERWATMLGHEFSEIEHTYDTWHSRVHPDDVDQALNDLTLHMEGKTSFYENIHRMRHKDGSWRYILDRGKMVDFDEQGNPIRFTGTHTDITEQKQAELAAKEATQAKSRFLANMSHEIRTPLHGMIGLLSVIDQTPLSDKDKGIFKTIQSSAFLLKDIINDILDFTKLEAAEVTLKNQPADLSKLIQDSIDLYTPMANEKNIALTYEPEEAKPYWYQADVLRLRQCINNLLSNGIKFTDKGKVSITLDVNGQGVNINVIDTGKGIENPEKIFSRFYQEGDENFVQGTGLGLSITKHITQLMGGDIQYHSELGNGAVFTLSLPLNPAEPPVIADKNHEEGTLPVKRILVAEDNEINQLVVSEMLSHLGQEYEIVDNGKLALDKLNTDSFDYLFLDMHMPVLDGMGTLAELEKNNTNIKVILMTADVFNNVQSPLIHASLNKPFEKSHLSSLLHSLQ